MWPKRNRKSVNEAQTALENAEKHLDVVKSREGEVQEVVQAFEQLSRENNFARNLREIMIIDKRRKA